MTLLSKTHPIDVLGMLWIRRIAPTAAKIVASRKSIGLSISDIEDVSVRATLKSGLKVRSKPNTGICTA